MIQREKEDLLSPEYSISYEHIYIGHSCETSQQSLIGNKKFLSKIDVLLHLKLEKKYTQKVFCS